MLSKAIVLLEKTKPEQRTMAKLSRNLELKCKGVSIEAASFLERRISTLESEIEDLARKVSEIREENNGEEAASSLLIAKTALFALSEKGKLSTGGTHVILKVSDCLNEIDKEYRNS